MERLSVDGKFLRAGNRRVFLRMVTYGPFPESWPEDLADDLKRIRDVGFEALRLYSWPDRAFLDAAEAAGLWVFAGLEWHQASDFLRANHGDAAMEALDAGLRTTGDHPALAGVFVANEIPTDLVRWMGPTRVLKTLEAIIDAGKLLRPELIWAYANYPSSEFLEPGNADLTAMNIYLEDEDSFRAYLRRLHHIAGDRPVLISEFGLDSRRQGEERQAECFSWAINAARQLGTVGMTVYAWSDRWWNNDAEVLDWDFGLTTREGAIKPALEAVRSAFERSTESEDPPSFSVIVCTRNGRDRIGTCLRSLQDLHGPEYEMVVVDDGSTDGTSGFVRQQFPEVRLVEMAAAGLSAARNAGAEAAKGTVLAFTDDDCEADVDWLDGLARCFSEGWEAAGGPNLPPPPANATEAVVASAPGAASHVMLDDREAEHVPGCNLAVTRDAFFEIGGFDPDFRTAGDDVDFCWRLRDAGKRIGFAPTAFVWHHRRPSIRGYLRQQIGYGRAEALLMRKHPSRFSPSGDARWHGMIYTGAAVRVAESATIYHGPMGLAGYQGINVHMQPLRDLPCRYAQPWNHALLRLITWLAPRLRSRARIGRFRGPVGTRPPASPAPDSEWARWAPHGREEELDRLLNEGWSPGGPNDPWDLERNGTRVLIACERHRQGKPRLLYRVWGDAGKLPELDDAEAM